MMLPHLAGRLFGVPLLLARPKLDLILAVLGSRLGLEPPAQWPEVGLLRPHSSPVQQVLHRPGIAVLPIHGTLVRRTVGLEAQSGLMSYATIGAELDGARALASEARDLRDEVRGHVAGQLRVVRKSFLTGFTAKVLTRDPRRLPALYVGSRIPWAGMHETGGTIGGRMLIPLHGRVGRKAFKAQVAELLRGGNAYFIKNAKGHVVLMAENIKEHDQPLRGFKRRYRKAEGVKRLKRGADIPIAVLVSRVTLKKRLDIARLVVGRVPRLARAIEQEIRVLDDR